MIQGFSRPHSKSRSQFWGCGAPFGLARGSDGTGTRRGVETILTGLRGRLVQEPLLGKGPWQPAFVEQCQELGAAMAAGLAAGIF